jgi:30S ribosomal protein S31
LLFYLIPLHSIKNTNMGRGDIKTKKGKIAKGSFGKSRPAKPAKKAAVAKTATAAATVVVKKAVVAKKAAVAKKAE